MEQAAALKLDLGKLFDIDMAVVVEEGAVVEVHVDCLPVQMRNEYSHVMPNGLHMGGMFSVRKPPDTLPLIKAGQDETVFKCTNRDRSSSGCRKISSVGFRHAGLL